MHEKHPIVMIFFLTLLTTSIALFLSTAWARLSTPHHIAILLLTPLPYLFTYLAATSTASILTPSNHSTHLTHYPYDHTLYHPARLCRTCHFAKPARSKHCSICRACVARMDHHCVWINNCVSGDNLRWFLALVLSLAVILVYGASLAYSLLQTDYAALSADVRSRGFLDKLSIVVARNPSLGAVGLLAALSAPLAIGLLGYHVYLIWAGTTTNETGKWGDLRWDMADGVVWKGERSVVYGNGNKVPGGEEDGKPTWPVTSDQVVVRTTDGRPPRGGGMEERGGREAWTRCWTLDEVENIYDLGFWDNLRDALNLGVS